MQSAVDGHSDCLQFFTILKKATINLYVYMFELVSVV